MLSWWGPVGERDSDSVPAELGLWIPWGGPSLPESWFSFLFHSRSGPCIDGWWMRRFWSCIDRHQRPEQNHAKRSDLCFSSSLRWKDASIPPQADADVKLGCSIDYSLHLLCVFSALCFFPCVFYCELLPLLCLIFPIHAQAVSMSHSKCSLLRSRPKVLLQTDSVFMVFSSINGLLSLDTMGFSVGHIFILVLNRNPAINITVWRQNCFHSQILKIIEVMGFSPETQLRSQVSEQWRLSGAAGLSPHHRRSNQTHGWDTEDSSWAQIKVCHQHEILIPAEYESDPRAVAANI